MASLLVDSALQTTNMKIEPNRIPTEQELGVAREIVHVAFSQFSDGPRLVEDDCTCWDCQKNAILNMKEYMENVLLDSTECPI